VATLSIISPVDYNSLEVPLSDLSTKETWVRKVREEEQKGRPRLSQVNFAEIFSSPNCSSIEDEKGFRSQPFPVFWQVTECANNNNNAKNFPSYRCRWMRVQTPESSTRSSVVSSKKLMLSAGCLSSFSPSFECPNMVVSPQPRPSMESQLT